MTVDLGAPQGVGVVQRRLLEAIASYGAGNADQLEQLMQVADVVASGAAFANLMENPEIGQIYTLLADLIGAVVLERLEMCDG